MSWVFNHIYPCVCDQPSQLCMPIDTKVRPTLDAANFLTTTLDTTSEECYHTLELLVDRRVWPVTQSQFRLFFVANRNRKIANTGLGVCGYSSIIVLPSACTALTLWVPPAGVVYTATFLSLLFSNLASMVYTGTWPNMDSDSQNADQNVLTRIKERFDNLGEFILEELAYGDRERMARLAAMIDGAWIRDTVFFLSTQKDHIHSVFEFFLVCLAYAQDPLRTVLERNGYLYFINSLRRRDLLPYPSAQGPYLGLSNGYPSLASSRTTSSPELEAVAPTHKRLLQISDKDKAGSGITLDLDEYQEDRNNNPSGGPAISADPTNNRDEDIDRLFHDQQPSLVKRM